MASIATDKDGRRIIQFFHPEDGKRKTLRLGRVDIKAARSVRVRVETIVAAKAQGVALDLDTAKWLADRPDGFYNKLMGVDLAHPREPKATHEKPAGTSLVSFLDGYMAIRTNAKPATLVVWRQTRRYLLDFFGPSKPIEEINPGDAEEWRIWLGERKNRRDKADPRTLSKTTINKRVGFAKQFFKFAVKKRLIAENPFAELKSTNLANRERDYFVTREEAEKVLASCPDAQWRLLFALSRYGGLRCPSEHLSLRWSDIDWERGRMRVRSPKTEHHEGGDSRLVPIFPELQPYLDTAWDELGDEPGEFVISRYRNAGVNLRRMLQKIIERAGLTPWPKLWHNLRATRQTELEEQFPSHVVCSWIGNSQAIARKHYLQVTDEHFEKALQNALHQVTTSDHIEANGDGGNDKKNETCKRDCNLASACTSESWRIGDSNKAGNSRGKPHSAISALQKALHSGDDPDLLTVIEAWPSLSASQRQAILSECNPQQR